MTATETTPLAGRRSGQPRGPSRRVRLPWLAAAAGLAVLVAALVLWGFGRAAERREVVMVVAPVEAGDPITGAALGSTMAAIDSSSTQLFSASQRAELVGKIAAIDLAPGDLLGPSLISTGPSVPDGWLEIGGLLRGPVPGLVECRRPVAGPPDGWRRCHPGSGVGRRVVGR